MCTKFAPYVAEYNSRLVFAKLGYTSPLSELDDKTAQVFLEISARYAKLEAAKHKAAIKKKGK